MLRTTDRVTQKFNDSHKQYIAKLPPTSQNWKKLWQKSPKWNLCKQSFTNYQWKSFLEAIWRSLWMDPRKKYVVTFKLIEVKADERCAAATHDDLRSPLTVTCQLISGRKLRKTIMIPFTIAYQSLICFFQSLLLSGSSVHTLKTTECNFPTSVLALLFQIWRRPQCFKITENLSHFLILAP